MRVALLSDIHGNAAALDAILADMRHRGPFDQVVVAGDLVWAGPWPAEVVDCVRSINAVVIQGNTDAFFDMPPDDIPAGKHEVRYATHLAWMQDRLGTDRIGYLAGLRFSHRIAPAPDQILLVVHANPENLEDPILPHLSDGALDEMLLPSARRDAWRVLAFGHVHVPFVCRWRDRLLVNVASAGLPMDGDLRAAYAVLTWDGQSWQAEHVRVSYDTRLVVHAMRTGGLPRGKHFAQRLLAARYDFTGPAVSTTGG